MSHVIGAEVSDDLMNRIEAYREDDVSRSAAIRELLEAGLEAEQDKTIPEKLTWALDWSDRFVNAGLVCTLLAILVPLLGGGLTGAAWMLSVLFLIAGLLGTGIGMLTLVVLMGLNYDLSGQFRPWYHVDFRGVLVR